MIYVGNGAALAECSQELNLLLKRLDCACFTTALAKGVVSDDHPLSLGAGLVEHGPGRPLLERADVLLVVGSSLDEVETVCWTLPWPRDIIQIDISTEMIGRTYPVAVELVGDAKAVLSQILEELPERTRSDSPAPWIAEIKTQVLKANEHKLAWRYIDAVQQALPQDAIVTNDACTANGWSMFFLKR
jgi:acetolactate synthase-1/2/3 large subunit